LSRSRAHGFTLIELVFLIVVFFGSVIALLSVVAEAAKRVGENDDYAKATQLAQEKAELILTDRRNPGRDYAYVTSAAYPTESPVSGYGDFVRAVAITDYSSNALCPSATNGCKLIVVTVSKNGATMATVTLTLANSS
jgi:type II secretory pathway pseudopilin PulG